MRRKLLVPSFGFSVAACLGLVGCPETEAPKSTAASTAQATAPAATPAAAPPAAVTPPPAPTPQPGDLPAPPDVAAAPADAVKTASGLASKVITPGTGKEHPAAEDTVKVHYTGWMTNGIMFDSSVKRGEPTEFPLNGVIKGWTKGVPGMKVGGIRKLTIPAALAYGAESPSPEIPPNSDLVFVIELVNALQIEDVKVGEGEEVGQRPICVTAYTLTGADGKVIESCGKDKPFVWLPGEHQGINFGLDGMKVGGKRKLTIPKELNVTAQGVPGVTRPSNVPVTVEIELINVKNLVPPQPKTP